MTDGPEDDPGLEGQRDAVDAVFRERWPPLDPSQPRALTERAWAEARRHIDQGGWTWLDRMMVEAVREGARPGDRLPPPHPEQGTSLSAETVIIGKGATRRVAVLFRHEDFPGARFGHRFEPAPSSGNRAALRTVERLETGALHRVMDGRPSGDSAGIIWMPWGTPNSDPELQQQRTAVEAAFREGWRPKPPARALTERAYAEARAILDHGGWTGLDPATIEAVRAGAQPGDSLPPPQPRPFIRHVTDVDVVIAGHGLGRRVAILFCHGHFPGVRFGHRFPLEPFAQDHELIWLMEEIDTGALHRMMQRQPSTDGEGIIWTAWGDPAA